MTQQRTHYIRAQGRVDAGWTGFGVGHLSYKYEERASVELLHSALISGMSPMLLKQKIAEINSAFPY